MTTQRPHSEFTVIKTQSCDLAVIWAHRDQNAHWQFIVTICFLMAWWRHQMETFSALLAICAGNSPVPGEFPTQRPVTRSFDVFFDLCLNKRLSKQSWGWWFVTLSCPLWRHRNGISTQIQFYIPPLLPHWPVDFDHLVKKKAICHKCKITRIDQNCSLGVYNPCMVSYMKIHI